jgi:hypothetical protein
MRLAIGALLGLFVMACCGHATSPPTLSAKQPPALSPACAAQLVADRNNRTFIVLFDQHSDVLSVKASKRLDEMIRLGRYDSVSVRLYGGRDTSETGKRDHGLVQRRLRAVQGYLLKNAPSLDWTIQPDQNSAPPLVPTGPDVAEAENRFVQLVPIGLGAAQDRAERRECWLWVRSQCIGVAAGHVPPGCYASLDSITGFNVSPRDKADP